MGEVASFLAVDDLAKYGATRKTAGTELGNAAARRVQAYRALIRPIEQGDLKVVEAVVAFDSHVDGLDHDELKHTLWRLGAVLRMARGQRLKDYLVQTDPADQHAGGQQVLEELTQLQKHDPGAYAQIRRAAYAQLLHEAHGTATTLSESAWLSEEQKDRLRNLVSEISR
jgi:hypothetical protein